MDVLRGQYPDFGGYDGQHADEGLEDEESGRELPPAVIGQDERRMQVRAYNFWASLLSDRSLPAIESLDPASLPDFGPYSVLLDFTGGLDDPAVEFLGEKLAKECGTGGVIRRLSDVPSRSLLSRITDHYMQILANQAPIGFEAEFVNQRGATIMYRGILLPFSSDDETIDYIYGVINWKELADQQTTDELLLEIDQALEPRRHSRDLGPLTDWADGPADSAGVLELGLHMRTDPADPENPEQGALASETAEPMALADWLASAREYALVAKGSEDRSRQALYAAIGRAYDFALAAADEPDEFAQLVADAGLSAQRRAPMTPLVKLVFGADYDKTRLTEYATVLTHAQRIGVPHGSLASYLADAAGGLKGIVTEERRLRRREAGKDSRLRSEPRQGIAERLRALTSHRVEDLPANGHEFTVLIARRLPDGGMTVLGEVGDDVALLERAARKLLA